jgi:isoleucyl-tRNA synthetase
MRRRAKARQALRIFSRMTVNGAAQRRITIMEVFMYEKVSTDLNFVKRETEIMEFWDKNGIIDKSLRHREGGKPFTFYDGPPTANGKPHIGHVVTRAVKDIIPRFRSMQGYDVTRKAGWDTHGLPVELEVEKRLGINGKPQIEEYGVAPFIEKCKESVWKYKSQWQDMSARVAYWADMRNAYVTYDNSYIESVWWSLKRIWDKGLIYKGHKVVPYCPRCGTALSSHEVAQGYKDVREKSIFVKFRITGRLAAAAGAASAPAPTAAASAPAPTAAAAAPAAGAAAGEGGAYFIAWTTTPWTLPSNVALVVHPDYAYAEVEWRGSRYILAKELVKSVFPEDDLPAAVAEHSGADLVGMTYEPLFGFAISDKAAAGSDGRANVGSNVGAGAGSGCRANAGSDGRATNGGASEGSALGAGGGAIREQDGWRICADRYVTLTEGSGIVHAAPAFGEDDARVGRDNGLPFVQLVDSQGRFVDAVEPWRGMFVKDADPLIIDALDRRGLLLRAQEHTHSYPFCWRCDTPLLYYARDAWFIKMTAVRESLIRNNDKINWLPDNIKRGRFGNFLENVVDWGLSRERYWGTPLPIWECAGCGHAHMVGSVRELRELSAGTPADIELHKPYIDGVKLECPRCGAPMRRVPEVIDCWYDSGAMPFAQWHYPFENRDVFERTFPADFISEAIDQTRGWFYTLISIATLLFDDTSFKNAIVLGHVLDKDGQKMSKHKNNVVDPWEVLDRQGADAVRWYFFSNSAPWMPCRFYSDAVSECQRKFIGTLWNTYAFYILYAEIDGFDPTAHALEYEKLDIMDRWALSRLHSLIKSVEADLSAYRITEPARSIQSFVDELSNWYVRRSRERYWQKGIGQDKVNAYMTLYTALSVLSKLLAPFVPFMTEMIHQNLVRSVDHGAPESVHLCDFPSADESLIDKALETSMQVALDAVTLGRSCRNTAGVKNRQPLSKMYIQLDEQRGGQFDMSYAPIITEELNVKGIEFVQDSSRFMAYRVKPQLKTLGPKYGKLLPKISERLSAADGSGLIAELEANGAVRFALGGHAEGAGVAQVELFRDDLLIESVRKDNFVSDFARGVTVVLDTAVTEELLEEGYVRELVSKIQNMRKEAGYEVQNHIRLSCAGSSAVAGILERNYAAIASETLTDGFIPQGGEAGAFRKEVDINAENVVLCVQRV